MQSYSENYSTVSYAGNASIKLFYCVIYVRLEICGAEILCKSLYN
jgi:hypothetical protein